MDIVTIDFETYYDKDYSLSKITTEEYVRSDQFEVIGVSVKVNNHPGDWYSGDDVGAFLNSLDYSDKAILCHHAAFDGAILSWRFSIKPKLWLDTLSMSRPTLGATIGSSLKMLATHFKVGEKGTEVIAAIGKRRADFTPEELARYGSYCINDGDITKKLFGKLAKSFPPLEIQIIDQTIRMYTEPVLELDKPTLVKHLSEVKAKKEELLLKLGNGDPAVAKKVLMSNKKFAALLEKLGVNPPTKISPTTDKLTYAFAKTDKGLLNLLGHSNPDVVAVVEARLGTKSTIEETRTQRLIDVSERGTLPIMLNYYGAHTGRFSGGDKLNLQNLPIRKSTAIRCAIIAPKGYKLVACDSSQIEARLLAFLAGQTDLVKAFQQGRDVYKEFASAIYGIAQEHITTEQRFVGKTCILGLGYGMGWARFIETLFEKGSMKIEEHEAKRIVYLYRATYPMIIKFWRLCDTALNDMIAGRAGVIGNILPYSVNGIALPNGMILKYNGLTIGQDGFQYLADPRQFRKFLKSKFVDNAEPSWTKIYGGKIVENVIQALARIVVTDQMVALRAAGYPVAFQVHDENIIVPAASDADAAKRVAERIMSQPPAWAPNLPIACEAGIGDSFGEVK